MTTIDKHHHKTNLHDLSTIIFFKPGVNESCSWIYVIDKGNCHHINSLIVPFRSHIHDKLSAEVVVNMAEGTGGVDNLVLLDIDLSIFVVSEVYFLELDLVAGSILQRVIRTRFNLFVTNFRHIIKSFFPCDFHCRGRKGTKIQEDKRRRWENRSIQKVDKEAIG